ncbi:hypothetical protein EOD42_08985 [Rhodovarius crocodyli]|uniref:Uncharacterized protein n=1 Tax=Rhodovarius crocodyli TaxID=1979269 RepID=A0A437MJR3_9PROT|nr:hypothetical protein [Rhodovarius crocodyli]RVT97914.1 hypothetical protein EOD42_08985 [Rhodovarius crocodyli]
MSLTICTDVSKIGSGVSNRLDKAAARIAREMQEISRLFVLFHGSRARGLIHFADALGVTERRARSLYEGTAGRIDAAEHAVALVARNELRRTRAHKLRAELEELENSPHAETAARARPGAVLAGQ